MNIVVNFIEDDFSFSHIMMIVGYCIFPIVLRISLLRKTYLNSEQIFIETTIFIKKTRYSFTWKEIARIEYKRKKLVLINNTGLKLNFSREWINYNSLFRQIYSRVTRYNPSCIIDKSFIDYINDLEKNSKIN
ncbi:hypothetical protein KHQ81_06185 [Mycoplasmatota bacterium]|nr:hypothetical protein KHQ81_06185 [Mycoplasmatota bacterium]